MRVAVLFTAPCLIIEVESGKTHSQAIALKSLVPLRNSIDHVRLHVVHAMWILLIFKVQEVIRQTKKTGNTRKAYGKHVWKLDEDEYFICVCPGPGMDATFERCLRPKAVAEKIPKKTRKRRSAMHTFSPVIPVNLN